VYRLKEEEPETEDEEAVAQMTRDERARMYRRRQLPTSFTGGPVVYASDIILCPWYMRHGCLRERLIPCIAEPGAEGAIEHLPYWDPRGEQMRAAPLDVLPADAAGPAKQDTLSVVPVEAAPAVLPRATAREPAVVEAIEAERPRVAKKKSGGLVLLLILAGVFIAGAGACGGAAGVYWWMSAQQARPVVLSNARARPWFGMTRAVAVDYQFTSGKPTLGARYHLVLRNTRTGQTLETVVDAGQMRGTLEITVSRRPPLPFRDNDDTYELRLDAELPDRPGVRVPISNTVTTR
jgi:hypothetical protein